MNKFTIKTPKKEWQPPAHKQFPVKDWIEQFDLLDHPCDGTKKSAEQVAEAWRKYPTDARARIIKIKGKYYVYGN